MLIKFPLEKAVVETIRKEEGDGDGEFGGRVPSLVRTALQSSTTKCSQQWLSSAAQSVSLSCQLKTSPYYGCHRPLTNTLSFPDCDPKATVDPACITAVFDAEPPLSICCVCRPY